MKKLFFALLAAAGISAHAEAKVFNYKCFSYFWNGETGEKGTLDLAVSPHAAQATLKNQDGEAIDKSNGPRNTNYRSRGSVRYAKFGYRIIAEESLITGGRRLDNGQLGGLARYEGEAEGGFFQYKFICKSK